MTDRLFDVCHRFFADRGHEVTWETQLVPSDIFDSVGLLELVMTLEEALSMEIDQEMITAENFKSIATLKQALRAKGYEV